MSNLQNDNLCECLKKFGQAFGAILFLNCQAGYYGGPLPMRQDLLPAWVYLEIVPFHKE